MKIRQIRTSYRLGGNKMSYLDSIRTREEKNELIYSTMCSAIDRITAVFPVNIDSLLSPAQRAKKQTLSSMQLEHHQTSKTIQAIKQWHESWISLIAEVITKGGNEWRKEIKLLNAQLRLGVV